MAYNPRDQKARDDLKKKEKQRLENWHEGQMKMINKRNNEGRTGSCMVLLTLPGATIAIAIAAAAKLYLS